MKNQVANVEITFEETKSVNYKEAVSISKTIPTYIESTKDNKLTHTVTLPVTEIGLLAELLKLVGKWKSLSLRINGESTTVSDLLYKGISCYKDQQQAHNPQQYCFGEKDFEFNIWGCKKLDMPVSEAGVQWLEYGFLDDDGLWHFDKDKIRAELIKVMENCSFCPILNRERILKTLEHLPETVNPRTSEHWLPKNSIRIVDGQPCEVTTGVRPIIKQMHHYCVDYKPTWIVTYVPKTIKI